MIVTCPSCTTRYFADDAAIGPGGRSVRCAACEHSWFVQGQLVLDQAAPDDLLPQPPAVISRQLLTRDDVERMRRNSAGASTARIQDRPANASRMAQVRAAALAWGGASAAIVATAGAGVAFKEDVVTLWPEAASAYAAVGVPVNAFGLEFANLAIERSFDGPTPVLIVSGEVRNVAGERKAAPPLRFALRDNQAKEIYRWVLRPDGREIPAGGAMPFETVIDNPPIQAEDLEATFASMREALEAGAAAMPPEQPPIVAPRGFTDEPLAEFEDVAPADASGEDWPGAAPGRAGPLRGAGPAMEEGAVSAVFAASQG